MKRYKSECFCYSFLKNEEVASKIDSICNRSAQSGFYLHSIEIIEDKHYCVVICEQENI
jgi:hypothetical protein